jgi:NAD(P)H dehydrogenase (quinone)
MFMTKMAIVYFSGMGHTHLMAEAVAKGAIQVEGTQVELLRIDGSQIVEGRWQDDDMLAKLQAADAIVFGSPTYMGGVAAQFKAFIDAASKVWFAQGWKDKIAGGFTHSGSPSGDKQGTLLYLATNALQHGMIWVGVEDMPYRTPGINRLGSFMGAMGQTTLDMSGAPATLDDGDRSTAANFGTRIAKAAKQWK